MDYRTFPVLQAGIQELFREHPTICGFSIDGQGHISLDCYPRETASEDLCAEVLQRLLELIDGRADAAAWLFNRTFVRVLH